MNENYYRDKAKEVAFSVGEYVDCLHCHILYDLWYTPDDLNEQAREVVLKMFHCTGFAAMHLITSAGLAPAANATSIQSLLELTDSSLWSDLSDSLQTQIRELDDAHAFIQKHGCGEALPLPWRTYMVGSYWNKLLANVTREFIQRGDAQRCLLRCAPIPSTR